MPLPHLAKSIFTPFVFFAVWLANVMAVAALLVYNRTAMPTSVAEDQRSLFSHSMMVTLQIFGVLLSAAVIACCLWTRQFRRWRPLLVLSTVYAVLVNLLVL